jgi:enoyl-CoA hydratase/carnithine racemase
MTIRCEVRDAAATVTIEGEGPRNLLTPELADELGDCLLRLDEDPTVRVVILTGAGANFSGGSDFGTLQDLLRADGVEDLLRRYWNPHDPRPVAATVAGSRLFGWRTTKPVVAAILGQCFDDALAAVGVHSHIRIAGVGARFGFPAIRHGLGGGFIARSRLARQIPRAALLWMIETAQEIDSSAALACFLVNEVLPDMAVMARARTIALAIAELPPETARAELRAFD